MGRGRGLLALEPYGTCAVWVTVSNPPAGYRAELADLVGSPGPGRPTA